MDKARLNALKQTAVACRLNVLRMVRASGHGHVGGALSAMDIVTALYFYQMKLDPRNPEWAGRDRFVLSAGHKCLCQYAALAERGVIPKTVLDSYGSLDSRIPGHPDMHKLPGIEANTGSLGHGLSISLGMALGLRLDGSDRRVYTLMGDGELAEGSNWEAAAAAAQHKADNLVLFIDNNGLQISGRVDEVMSFRPIAAHFAAFGWATKEIDGNSMEQIVAALDELPLCAGKPTAIVCHTIKAKSLPFGENQVAFHFWKANEAQLRQAEEALAAEAAALREEAI